MSDSLTKLVHLQTNDKIIHVSQFGELFIYKKTRKKGGIVFVKVAELKLPDSSAALIIAAAALSSNVEIKPEKIIFHLTEKKQSEKRKRKPLDVVPEKELDSNPN